MLRRFWLTLPAVAWSRRYSAVPMSGPPFRRLRKPLLLARALVAVLRVRVGLWLRSGAAVRADIARHHSRHHSRHRASVAPTPGALREVAWSVRAAARLVPGATCLTQAHAGQLLLARRGMGSVVRLSVPADATAGFRPHAWLIAQAGPDAVIVLGGTAADYAVHQPLVDLAQDRSARAPRDSAPSAAALRR